MNEDINKSLSLVVSKNQNIKQNRNKQQKNQITIKSLFRFADKTDYMLMTVGIFSSLIMGAAFPIFSLLWGQITDAFSKGGDELVNQAHRIMLIFIYVGIGAFVFGWIMFSCWMITAERQAIQCRKTYLKYLLLQQIGWFDLINQSQLTSKFASDNFAFQGALGEKMSTILMSIGLFISSFVIAFYTGWLMTLVIFVCIPALGISGAYHIKFLKQKDKQLQKFYDQAGGKAQQALSQIKTVKQLNGQQFQQLKYGKALENVGSKALKYALYTGIAMGTFFCINTAAYALGFWYGSQCVQQTSSCPKFISNQTYTAGNVLVIFFSIVFVGYNFSQLIPAVRKVIQGRQAAQRIFKIIDRDPLIKNSLNPLRPEKFHGIIKFENVTFAYPKDKSKKVLNNLNLQFKQNSSALVGQSGCGKSTIFQLIMRFYDPDQGRITLDGIDLRQLDLNWLRENIGYVGQQPVLFATTIKQNLLFGKKDASDNELIYALKNAEVYEFVQTLDQKLDTFVGYGGGQLSGGQKQRIAIARALLRNPKILLLDQATSALDRKNERLIQATLDKICQNRTSITIAHRAKTIMKSDIVYVVSQGQIIQSGKFNKLQRFKGINIEKQEEFLLSSQSNQKDKQNQPKSAMIKSRNVRIDFTILNCGQQQKNQALRTNQEKQQQKKKKLQQQLVKKYEKQIFRRILSYTKQKRIFFGIGVIVAYINGSIFPVFTIFLSKMLTTLLNFNKNQVQSRKDANFYALIIFLLAILAFFIAVIQNVLFSLIGQDITKKIRFQVFNKILRMPIPWFDNPKNNAGSLTAKLASDCNIVNGLATSFIAIMIQNVASLIDGITIAFIFQWRTAFVALGLIPFIILTGVIQMAYNAGFSQQTDTAYKQSSNMIMESMLNVRTIYSFCYQDAILKKYSDKLEHPLNVGTKKGFVTGFFFGISQFMLFIIFGLIFYIGALFVKDVGVSVSNVFTAIYGIVFSAIAVGNTFHFSPDLGVAKVSAANLFEILDCQDQDQKQFKEESKFIKNGIQGNIQFKYIKFKYQTRNDYVFDNLNLNIKKGQKIGLVGHSGCGKSTIFQLLLRFYEPSKGQILIDGINIKQYDIHYLRSCFGVVSQEPVLFNQSFRDNIIYNMKNISEQRLKQVCRQANALTFIKNENQSIKLLIPLSQNRLSQVIEQDIIDQPVVNGFNRNVGVKGNHLSGGQKQRIAIARALLRNPIILLLDQATSALDNENQQQIQEALDKCMINKTTVSIAHRVQTIKNCDQINVFDHGMIIQKGKYKELINKKGYFYSLQKGTNFL